jgi:peptide/nickel transport system ATP-binding protein
MAKPLLDVRHLRVATVPSNRRETERKLLVDDVSFTLERGQVLGLIGESGAGKSTIGLSVLGYCRSGIAFDGGEVWFDSQNLLALSDRQLSRVRGSRIAYVAQSAASSFNPAFTLGEQVIESVVANGTLPKKQALARAQELFELLGLPDPAGFLKRYPHQVSGGQLQRAMTAMALCAQPDLIVFDEPTTALDVSTQIGVLLAIRKAIQATGVAALYISHDLAVVAQIVDQILVLRHGRCVEHGDVAQIINAPAEDYTRQLVNLRGRTGPSAGESDLPILSVRDVCMSYRSGPQVLTDVSIALPPAHTLALVGESGSGKSSLGRVLCGLAPATRGDILFRNRPLPKGVAQRSKDELRRLQLVHQLPDIALNPRQTVEVIIGRPLTHYFGMTGAQRRSRVTELLRLVDLDTTLLHRYPGALSGGQKQRICIARALAAEPDVIICDEPTSALDPLVAQGVLSLLGRLQRETGVSLLFITHDINIVRSIAHSVAIMHRGKVIRSGVTSSVLAPPYDVETERLLNAVPEMEVGWLDRWSAKHRGTGTALASISPAVPHSSDLPKTSHQFEGIVCTKNFVTAPRSN